jgi:hypothetical protein
MSDFFLKKNINKMDGLFRNGVVCAGLVQQEQGGPSLKPEADGTQSTSYA